MSNTNDTIIPLIAGGTFTGTFQKRDVNSIASVNVFSSTTCDVRIQQAPNTTNVVNNDLFLYDPSGAVIFQQYLVLDYFRVVVTNTSGVDQTFLRITTKLSNVLEPLSESISVSVVLTPASDGVLVYGANGGNAAIPVALWVDASGLIQDVNSAANTAVLANLDGCISANKVAVDIGAVDISGQNVIVSNFAELVTDLSGQHVIVNNFPASQAVTVSGCPPVQMLGSLTQTNAFYLDNVATGIIASISVLGGYVTIELDSDPGFTAGQTIILTSVTALPQLSGRTYQIDGTFSGPTTQNLMIYTPDLSNLAVTAATGVVQSVRVTPLICTQYGNVLVDISGQDVRVNNFVDLVTDLSGVFVHVDNFPATQDITGTVSVSNLQDISGITVVTDISGQTVVVNFAELVTDLSGVFVHVNNFPAVQDISGVVSVSNLQDISGITVVTDISGQTVLVDISGQTVLVGNFPNQQVVDVSGVVVTSSLHLNNLNATYSAGAVTVAIITAAPETNVPYVNIELASATVFTIGQQVVISGATTFPGLNGVRTITEVLSSTVYGIYFEGLTGFGADVPETGAMRSFGSSPLLADVSGNLLVKIEGTAAVSVSGDVSVVQKPTTLAYRNIATSNTGDVVSAGPATIRQFCAQNSSGGTNQYVKLYNMATAPSSSDTPVFTFLLGAGSGIVANVILNHTFSVGIGIRATLNPADNDNTAASNFVFTNLTYSV